MLILAGSGTGKTTLIEKLKSKYVLDGDDVVAESLGGWPEGRWWETMSPEEKADFVGKVWPAILNSARNRVVLFGVNPTTIFTETVTEMAYDSGIHVWVPPIEELERNAASRRESGVKNQPNELEQLLQARDRMSEFASGSKMVDSTLTSTNDVLNLIKEWIAAVQPGGLKLTPINVGTITIDSAFRRMVEFKFRGVNVLCTTDGSDYRRVEWGGSIDDTVVTLLDPLAHANEYSNAVKAAEDAFWWAYSKTNTRR